MKSVWTVIYALCLLLLGMHAGALALTFDFKSVKLSADQRAALKLFLADSSPAMDFDWRTLEAHRQSVGRKRQPPPLSVTMNTVPALSTAGICRSEQRHFYFGAATEGGSGSSSGKGRWHANDDLTRLHAWTAQGPDCALEASPIRVDKLLSDADFAFIERGKDLLLGRAAGVIGGSDCARIRYCELTLRRINRVREESPLRTSRTLTKLTFSPLKPGPSCLYVMEVTFVGPINDLVPLGASCPKP